jgi:hypothetical protein
MKAIHGGKAKNDKIDAHKIAVLLRGGMLPMAYVYPREMRATRDLLRRRCHFTRKRAELFTHIQNTASQYVLPALGKIAFHGNRIGLAEHFPGFTPIDEAAKSEHAAAGPRPRTTQQDRDSPLHSRQRFGCRHPERRRRRERPGIACGLPGTPGSQCSRCKRRIVPRTCDAVSGA